MSRRTMTRRDCCTGSERLAGALAGVEAQRPDLSDPEGKGDTRSEADSGRRPHTLQLICASSPMPRCFEAEESPCYWDQTGGSWLLPCLLFPSTGSLTSFLLCQTKKRVQENTERPQTRLSMLKDNEGNVLIVLFQMQTCDVSSVLKNGVP